MNNPTKFILKKILVLLLFTSIGIWKANAQNSIKRKEIKKIVQTLSDDQMKGRSALGEGGQKAANYINNYFEELGLQKPKGSSNYLQTFSLNQLKPKTIKVSLDGHNIPEDEMFLISNHESLHWTSNSAIEQIHISAEDDFPGTFRKMNGMEKDLIVTVAGVHLKTFERYRNYFSKGSKFLDNEEDKHSKLFILSNPIAINDYEIEILQEKKKFQLANVLGMIPGKSKANEYVIFSAHYDHIGILQMQKGDSIANGADDDASGTTAVMSLAKYFKNKGGGERTIVFVAFTAEEIGGYGSQYFSKQYDPASISAMFNIEMIGKLSKFGKNSAFITGFDKSDFGEILQKNLQGSPYRYFPDPYPDQRLFYRSDNATLARLGVPAHTISTDQIDSDPHYHQVSDEFETLDLRNMTNIIRSIAKSAQSIVLGKDTPIRIMEE
ncbi:M20/M25/M40 family metallo-hydrolase [Xanthovirga aplysinae]|uniref:M20/M25/M40 family metallo-hydrolase n=1 Tax=Xanthovirga aplysinae TaxID=2529853 RepID=UPI0012BC6740|nr:M20/M25/M40 family metallo-hydrolase [Xanthovirga aplysinae]MTI31976.1 M20/M25/M40 family metallo-hydrolase [Xanthovirga aplysinae]